MNQRPPSSSPKFLWLAIATAYLIFVVAGTFNPWLVAAEQLAAVGAGPYVPLTYSFVASDRMTYRSQVYLVASQVGSSWSTYRVSEENNVATVEEVRGGLLYAAGIAIAIIFGAILGFRRSASKQGSVADEA